MTTSIWIVITVICAILLVIFIVSGIWAPRLLICGNPEDDLLEGFVVFQTESGSLIRLKGGYLCWSEMPVDLDTTVLIRFLKMTDETSFESGIEPVQKVFSLQRALWDPQGQKVSVVKRITDDTVICQAEDEVLLVECTTGDQEKANRFAEDRQSYLTIRKEGVRMLPLCEVVKS